MKELVDGTIRVQIDIDPMYRAQFLKLFPSIDMPIALAPLMIEPTPEAKPAFAQVSHKQVAAMLCKDSEFWEFWGEQKGASPETEDDAAISLRDWLGVKSRADIDTNAQAAEKFTRLVKDFEAWRKWAAD